MPLKLILMNEQILTIHDALYEDDVFCFDYKHSPEETIFNLPIKNEEMGDMLCH